VFRILDLARRFESQGATSFRSFVLRLQEDAERGGAAEAPVVEEGTEGVRMMTVHRAKGLEFPVVVLVDPTANAVMREPSRYVDSRIGLWAMPLAGCSPIELVEKRDEVLRHDREEAHRLMYVAATRARDLLVVPAVGDEAISGWVDVLHPVMYPAQERRREGERAPGCPQFTGDSVKERPAETVRGTSDSVAPGLHRPRLGSHRVVWWDPNVLDLDKEHDVGLRQQRILAADDGGVATEGERLHAAWQAQRASVREAGAKPSLAIQTVTGAKDAAATLAGAPVPASLAAVPAVPHETTGALRSGRPRGKRFGVLVHAILAAAPLDASPAKLAEVARAEARHVGAASEEIEAGIVAATAALAHPLFARARAAATTPDGCRREAPIMLTLEDGSLVEGVLDLAFRETDADGPVWTVVDFKTDAELDGPRRASYELQLSLYARAIEAATGERARTVLLSV
jgi:ATP-dependent exoDNAse (exonuclease V) beta subunit